MTGVSCLRAAGNFLCCAALFGLAGGCKRQAAPDPAGSATGPRGSAPASAPPPVEEPSSCHQLPGWGLTLATDDPAAAKPPTSDPGEDEADDALLPFGVDIGEAVATPSGFAVAGLRGASQAFVALVAAGGSRRVDLGELHGDAESPALSVIGERVLVALRSSDAAGFTIKLGSMSSVGGEVAWGYELSKLGKSVTGLELATSGARGVLVFQSEDKAGARLLLGSFDPSLKEPFGVKPLEVKDAEMPRLLARPGGYWLSWVRSLPEPKKAPATAPTSDADAGPRDPEERELLEVGLRVVEVAKLDEQGKLLGTAKRVGEPRRQVLLYDVALLASGGLLVATRSDNSSPGAEVGALLLSEVSNDGTVRSEQLDDDELGAGAPTLLVERETQLPGPWLTVAGPSDATRVGLARGAKTLLRSDPVLGYSEILAVRGGHFLAQRARGRSVALEVLECAWPADPPLEKK